MEEKKPHGLLGKKRSKESIEKQRQTITGRKFSDETKQKMRLAKLGKPSHRRGKTWKVIDGRRIWMERSE